MKTLDNIFIILLYPKRSGNVGSVARAMKNFGFRNLRIVSKRNPAATIQARKMAVHADDILSRAEIFTDPAEAYRDLNLLVGTSGKFHKDPPARLELDDFGEFLPNAAKNRIGFLFGPEDRGLSGDELSLCNYMLAIPTSSDYPSINLSHAVSLVAFETYRRLSGSRMTEPKRLASKESMERFYERMREVYLDIGFLDKVNPQRIMKVLRGIYDRNSLNEREVRILMGVLKQMEWFRNSRG